MHLAGYAHNDLKTDQVSLEFIEDSVSVTLLYVGDVLHIGQSVDIQVHPKYSEDWYREEKLRQDCHRHLAPEYFHGGPCSPATDMYSFGHLINRSLE